MSNEIEDQKNEEQLPEQGNMSLLDHLVELRQRLLYSSLAWVAAIIVCFFFSDAILKFLLEPLHRLLAEDSRFTQNGVKPRVIFTALYELLFTKIKAAVFLGTILISPFFLAQVWGFIAPGLYKSERRAFAPFLLATPFLFLLGSALVYYVLMPFAWSFFLSMQQIGEQDALDIVLEAKIDQYFNLVMRLILAFGFCFQLPVAATLMAKVGIIDSRGMVNARKYAILAVFVVAAVVTPPDPISQLSLAIPIVILYEISIYLVRLIERSRGQVFDDDEWEDDDEETPDP